MKKKILIPLFLTLFLCLTLSAVMTSAYAAEVCHAGVESETVAQDTEIVEEAGSQDAVSPEEAEPETGPHDPDVH